MFKTEVVNSRNIRRTLAFKIFQAILIVILLFIIAMAMGIFGPNSSISTIFNENQSQIIRPIAIAIIIASAGLSIVMSSRMKNPIFIGHIELDEKGYRFTVNEKVEHSGEWGKARLVSFEYFSVAKLKNPRGCQNYLTIVDNQGIRTYEITIESSLLKADLGEMLRLINQKVPVKVTYTIPFKKIFKDNDLKM